MNHHSKPTYDGVKIINPISEFNGRTSKKYDMPLPATQ
jgi:hypothetical protein